MLSAKVLLIEMGRYTQLPYTIFSTHKMHNDRQILRSQQFMEANLERELTVEGMANHLGMSVRNFDPVFAAPLGRRHPCIFRSSESRRPNGFSKHKREHSGSYAEGGISGRTIISATLSRPYGVVTQGLPSKIRDQGCSNRFEGRAVCYTPPRRFGLEAARSLRRQVTSRIAFAASVRCPPNFGSAS